MSIAVRMTSRSGDSLARSLFVVTTATIASILSVLPTDPADDALARLSKLSEQLDTAKKSAEVAAKEVAQAKSTTDQVKKDIRLLDTSKKKTRRRKPQPKRKSPARKKR